MELRDVDPGDTAILPVFPGRVLIEGTEAVDYSASGHLLLRVFWVTSEGEGQLSLPEWVDVTRVGRFTDYATRPEYSPWTGTWRLFHPDGKAA